MNQKYHALLACLLISGCSTNAVLNPAPTEDTSIVNFTIPAKTIFSEDKNDTVKNEEDLHHISKKVEILTEKIKKVPSLKNEKSKNQTKETNTKKEIQTIVNTSKPKTNIPKPKETKTTKTETKPKNPDPNKTEDTNPKIETKEDSIVTTKDNCQGSGLVFQGNEACANALNTSYGEIVNLYPGTDKGFDDARTWAMDKFNTDYNGKYLDTYDIDYVEFTDGNFYYVVQFTYIDLEA